MYQADAVIVTETFEKILSEALETQSEEAEPLGLRVSWTKSEVQAFGLDSTVESISVSDENVQVTQTFAYHGSVIHSNQEWLAGN